MLILQKIWASQVLFLQTFWLGFIFVKREISAVLRLLLPTALSASFGHDDSWQALLIFSLTAHAVTKALVVHRKWAFISAVGMTFHTRCIPSSQWLCHVVPRGELLISLHYHYWSTSKSGEGIKISHYLTLSLYSENLSSHTCKRCCELPKDHDKIRYFHHLKHFIISSVISLENHCIATENLIIGHINMVLDLVFL